MFLSSFVFCFCHVFVTVFFLFMLLFLFLFLSCFETSLFEFATSFFEFATSLCALRIAGYHARGQEIGKYCPLPEPWRRRSIVDQL